MATIDQSLRISSSVLEDIGKKLQSVSPKMAFACTAIAGIGMSMTGAAEMIHAVPAMLAQGSSGAEVLAMLTSAAFEQVSEYVKGSVVDGKIMSSEGFYGHGAVALAAAPLAAAAAAALNRAGKAIEYVGQKLKDSRPAPEPEGAQSVAVASAGLSFETMSDYDRGFVKGTIGRQVNELTRLQSQIGDLQTEFSEAGDIFERREAAIKIEQGVRDMSKAGEGLRNAVLGPGIQLEIATSPGLQAVIKLGADALRSVAKEPDIGAVMKVDLANMANTIVPKSTQPEPEPAVSRGFGR